MKENNLEKLTYLINIRINNIVNVKDHRSES